MKEPVAQLAVETLLFPALFAGDAAPHTRKEVIFVYNTRVEIKTTSEAAPPVLLV